MASVLKVDQLQGVSTASSVHIPGHIIQIQRASIGGNISTSSTTPVASGLQCSITPLYSTSLIQIRLLGGRSYVAANQQLDVSLYKDGSNVNTVGTGRWESMYTNGFKFIASIITESP